ncbi:unnamed protein product [Rhizophagus irregularis]|nr:unnamed protein product [Rhizophagus irregularis]
MTKENYEIQTKLDKIIDRYRHLEEDIGNIKKKVATHYEEWTRNRDIKLELIEDEEWSALLVYYLPQVQVRRKNEAIKETNNAGIGGITYSPSYCLRVDHSGRQYYRFGYLKDTIENTYLRDELITTSNDPLANPHDRLQLQEDAVVKDENDLDFENPDDNENDVRPIG